jgi:ribose transport system substrate-binding protein
MDVFEGQNDVQNEAKAVSTCIAQGYDAIFINPSDINAIVPSLMEAKDAGIVVGMFSSDLPKESQQYRDFFCGVDDTMAGQTAGQAFVDHFPDGATIVEVGGQAGHDAQIKRADGFRQVIGSSNITLLDLRTAPVCHRRRHGDHEDFIVKYAIRFRCSATGTTATASSKRSRMPLTDVYSFR